MTQLRSGDVLSSFISMEQFRSKASSVIYSLTICCFILTIVSRRILDAATDGSLMQCSSTMRQPSERRDPTV